jgi:hypothetical protein
MTRSIWPALALLLAAACAAKDPGTDTGAAEEGSSEGDPQDGPTTGPSGGSASSTTGADGTGGDPALPTACMDYCAHLAECMPDAGVPVEMCAAECSQELGDDAECIAAAATFYDCLAQADCSLITGEVPVCPAEEEAVDAACSDGDECWVGFGDLPDGCAIMWGCEGQPDQTLECDAEACTCLVDEVETASCPVADACADQSVSTFEAIAMECCGWMP